MRLATLRIADTTHAAVVVDDQAKLIDGYTDVGALVRGGKAGLEAARRAETEGRSARLENGSVRRPILSPGAVVCVGLNYRKHILEMGREPPTHPTLFSKLPRALADPFAEIELPSTSKMMDYEGELAVIIGRGGRFIPVQDAWQHVAGFAVFNDVSARDYQRRSPQWFAGKTFQSSTPMGPWLVTPDEVGDLADLSLTLTVNGEERQRATLGDLIFDVPSLIADLSNIVELQPADVIATGTPGGVGDAHGTYLADGDVVETTIERVGSIKNVFRMSGR